MLSRAPIVDGDCRDDGEQDGVCRDAQRHLDHVLCGERHEELRGICRVSALRRLTGELVGERLSRVPNGYPADHPAAGR